MLLNLLVYFGAVAAVILFQNQG